MKNKILALTIALLAASQTVTADPVQSTTGVYLSFRDCLPSATPCESFTPVKVHKAGGLPGETAASAQHAEPAYGEADGSAKLTGPGTAELSASASSLPGKRTGGNSITLQRYTNGTASTEALTFTATLTYNQTVPAENASIPADSNGHSAPYAEIVIFRTNLESVEAGTTIEENVTLLLEGPDESTISEVLAESTERVPNETGSGTKTVTSAVTVEPDDSIWWVAILQSLAANGAVVNGTLTVSLESTAAK